MAKPWEINIMQKISLTLLILAVFMHSNLQKAQVLACDKTRYQEILPKSNITEAEAKAICANKGGIYHFDEY
jgi:hypothetical protein